MADPAVGYVVSRWGEPTQTFVRREAEALAEQVGPVVAWSIKRPRACPSFVPVRHLAFVSLAVSVGWALMRRPRRVLTVLWTVFRYSSARNMASHFAAALTGVAWSVRGPLPEHLHAHFGWVAAAAAWSFSQCADVPFSVTLHAFELHTTGKQDRFAAVPLHAATRVFVVTAADVDAIRRRWGVQAEKVKMGLPDEWFQSVPSERPRPWRIVSVGSLAPKKGHAHLLKALVQADERWDLVICGEGDERKDLISLVRDLGLEGRVHLVGLASERKIRDLLDTSAVFCLAAVEAPSGDKDGTPVAIIEAMARGVPVISTSVGGIPDLVGDSGIIVTPSDVDGIVDALEQLVSPQRRAQLGASGRRRVVEQGFRSADAVAPLCAAIDATRRRAS